MPPFPAHLGSHPLDHMTNVQLKPGNESSEFKGKITAQAVLGIIAIANVILEQIGREPVLLDAETATLIAIGLEALWTTFRQGNKALEIRAQGAVRVAELYSPNPKESAL